MQHRNHGPAHPVRRPREAATGTVGALPGPAEPIGPGAFDDGHLGLALEAAGAGTWAFWPFEGRFEADAQARRLHGLAPGAPLDQAQALAAVHPDDRPGLQQALGDTVAAGRPMRSEHRVLWPDGSMHWVSSHARLRPGPPAVVVGLVQDITERKRTEQSLLQRTRQLDLLARSSQLLLVDGLPTRDMLAAVFGEIARSVDAEVHLSYERVDAVSMALSTWSGLTDEERARFERVSRGEGLCGRVALQREPLVVEDIAHAQADGCDTARAAGFAAYAGFPLVAADRLLGTVAFITRTKRHFAPGEVQLVQSVCDQVAARLERIRLTDELRDSEERMQQALRVSRSFTFQWEPRTDRVLRSASCGAILQLDGDEAMNDTARRFFERVHPDDRARFGATISSLTPSSPGYRIEYRAIRGDGDVVTLEEDGHARFDEAGALQRLVGVTTDVTERKQSEDALRLARDSFRQLVEQSPFGVYAVDADFRLVMVSAGAQRVFQSVRPLLQRDFDEVLHILWPEPFASEALAHFRHTLATGEPYHAPRTVEQRQDIGQTEAYDWKIERVMLPDGRPGVVCHFYDLSERERFEETLRVAHDRLETALDASQVVLFHQDLALRYTWVHNPALGYAAQEVVGQRDVDLFQRVEDARHIEAIKRTVIETGVARREEVCIVQDGEPRHYDLVMQPDRDAAGEVRGLTCAAVDITARKRSEQQLQLADRQKDEFLAMLAHELRNPLAPIRNASAILARVVPNDPALTGPLAMIVRQTTQLTRLVDELLDVARIARGQVELTPELLEVGLLIEQAAETVQPLVAEKQHRLRIDRPQEKLYLRGDRTRLVQALANLLHNAAKYTDPQGDIVLAVRATGEHLDIEVRDTGVGITAELLPRVFDLFVQSERTLDRAQGGLGIGLRVVKRLVEMHGGTVRAFSEGSGQGAVFVIRLQRAAAPSAPPAGPPAAVRAAPRRIMVVDDNRDAADSLAMLLSLEGHAVQTFYAALPALDAVADGRPELVLIDIGMPGIDGYELARRLPGRCAPGSSRPKLVAVTGYGQDADRARAFEAGFDAHLVKPVDMASLEATLDALGVASRAG